MIQEIVWRLFDSVAPLAIVGLLAVVLCIVLKGREGA